MDPKYQNFESKAYHMNNIQVLNVNCWFSPPCLGQRMSGAPGEVLSVHHDENEDVDNYRVYLKQKIHF